MVRNRGDKIVTADTIAAWQRCFRVLKDWEIVYREDTKLQSGKQCRNGMVVYCDKNRRAFVFPCPKRVAMGKYVLHEMIHVAIRAAGRSRAKQELLTQDLCALIERGVAWVMTRTLVSNIA